MANIQKLAGERKLLLAGLFTDGGDLRGIFVFRVGSTAEAQALAETDPAVRAGVSASSPIPGTRRRTSR
jgi:uncharacterized protein YciI